MGIPFTVRARLSAGYAHATPWGVSLDGLLASEIWETRKATARAAGEDWCAYDLDRTPEDIELLLDRCDGDSTGHWHWAATFACPEDELPGPHVHTWTARPDQHALAQMTGRLPTHVDTRKGRYRAWVMPLPLTVAPTLVWRAVGDPDVVADLLAGVVTIGKKRASGHGQVLDWNVTDDGAADRWEFMHLHPDGRLGRTVPPTCLHGARRDRARRARADRTAAAVHASRSARGRDVAGLRSVVGGSGQGLMNGSRGAVRRCIEWTRSFSLRLLRVW